MLIVNSLKRRPKVGILVQLPLPAGLDASAVLERFIREDVDAFHLQH
jgi:5,10-methylene-tetrahydrofolate dehydrogenase/methenyl tetrahydrofolate cyclohydrolase